MTQPTRKIAVDWEAEATTMTSSPMARATEPADAPIHGAVRPNTSCATEPQPASTKMLMAATRWSVESKSLAESCGPRDRKSPATDQDERTARAASRKGPRTTGGTPGRCGVNRGRERGDTDSGMRSAPTNATAKRANRTT